MQLGFEIGLLMVQHSKDPTDYPALTERVRTNDCGAIVPFLGSVRELTDGRVTVALDYEAYPGMAEKKMAEIERETRARGPVGDLVMVHRLAHPGGRAVSAAAAESGARRAPASQACRDATNPLKEARPV